MMNRLEPEEEQRIVDKIVKNMKSFLKLKSEIIKHREIRLIRNFFELEKEDYFIKV